MQLSEYPFDKQYIKLRFQPALNHNAYNFKIIAGLSDSNVKAYATSIDIDDYSASQDTVGKTVSGMSVTQ